VRTGSIKRGTLPDFFYKYRLKMAFCISYSSCISCGSLRTFSQLYPRHSRWLTIIDFISVISLIRHATNIIKILYGDCSIFTFCIYRKSLNRSPRLLLLQWSQIPGLYSRPGLYSMIYGTLFSRPTGRYASTVRFTKKPKFSHPEIARFMQHLLDSGE